GITLMAIGMSFAGSYGVPRRHWDIEFSGAPLSAGFDAAAHFMMGVVGIGGTLAFIGLLIFIFLTVATVFFGKPVTGQAFYSWQKPETAKMTADLLSNREKLEKAPHKVPGTVVLVFVLLISFMVYYFANWKALTDVWYVR
ncbi:MAG: cytochrome C oxidase subunit I, partial [Calditrichaeota bacterium]